MKKLFIIFSLFLFGGQIAIAQTNEPIYAQLDVAAAYSGGVPKLYKFINDNLKYPEEAIKANVSGKVIVKMIIEKDGSIGVTTIMHGIGYGCDEEAERVLKSMPKWVAGKVDGKEVRSTYQLPILFDLKNTKNRIIK